MSHVYQDMVARTRALRETEQILRGVFDNWGYDEVIVPTLMPYETLRRSQSSTEASAYKLIDESGRILVLRPDMTAPIAERSATEWGEAPRPLRVSYFSTLFRRGEGKPGVSQEYFQAGVELIGSPEAAADAEVLALACEALEKAGMHSFQINVGHNALLRAITGRLGLSGEAEESLRSALQARDIVGVQGLMETLSLPTEGEGLLECLLPFGSASMDPEELLESLRTFDLPEQLLAEICQIFRTLRHSHPERLVRLDVSLVRDLDYYTGPVFEIYCPVTGAMLGGGGRYDGLISVFGPAEPATGLALDLEQIALSLEQQVGRREGEQPTFIALTNEGSDQSCWDEARRLRQAGHRVIVNRPLSDRPDSAKGCEISGGVIHE